MLGWPGLKTVYTRVGSSGQGNSEAPADTIGTIQYEFIDWRERKPAQEILADLRVAMQGIPGVDIEVSVPAAGPPTGKAIQIQLSADDPSGLKIPPARLHELAAIEYDDVERFALAGVD